MADLIKSELDSVAMVNIQVKVQDSLEAAA